MCTRAVIINIRKTFEIPLLHWLTARDKKGIKCECSVNLQPGVSAVRFVHTRARAVNLRNLNSVGRVTKMFHRIYDVIAVLLCILSIVQSRSIGNSEYWYNPCHHNSNNQIPSFNGYPITKGDMTRMKEQLNTSLGSVEESVKNFTQTIFGASIKDFLNNWHNTGITHVQWLHSDLGEPKKYSNDSFSQLLKELSMKELVEVHKAFYQLMKESFRRYIRIAKAIERMKEDMQDPKYAIRYERSRLELLNLIREEVRKNLKQVLCEIYECVLKIDQNFVQQVLDEDERIDIKYDYTDETSRHLRDGFIYGDLVVTLDHILQFMRIYEKMAV
ncbi:uncharacterized protein LOC129763184 [Toxorhynchites rutilus septentrionalis]|uniref:uncharacterized protein LOC129763184 n=1 Tax=Toxorhynchites rutilus septentrionalis TaxID=329112 RepID=UPI00247A2277|nr:uncharacterized protein LOC129763184 [Toxorhynchites rutilus septentrionalis]